MCEKGPKLGFDYLPTSKTLHCVRTACMAFPVGAFRFLGIHFSSELFRVKYNLSPKVCPNPQVPRADFAQTTSPVSPLDVGATRWSARLSSVSGKRGHAQPQRHHVCT